MVEVDPAIASLSATQQDEAIITTSTTTDSSIPEGTLNNAYTVYAQNKSDGWDEKNIKPLASFSTIDQFWGMYQHLKRPNEMPEGTTINIFQRGIKPVWEVDEHREGASLRLQFSKGYANQIWEDLILAFIGEQFELENEITGIVLSIGRIDKLSIWFRHGFDNRVAPQIKADMIRLLGLPADVKTSVSIFFPQNAPNKRGGGAPDNKRQPAAPAQSNNDNKNANAGRNRELTSYSSTNATGTDSVAVAIGMDDMLE